MTLGISDVLYEVPRPTVLALPQPQYVQWFRGGLVFEAHRLKSSDLVVSLPESQPTLSLSLAIVKHLCSDPPVEGERGVVSS